VTSAIVSDDVASTNKEAYMTGIRKVLTKAEAVAEAFYIAKTLTETPYHPAHAKIEGVWHDEEWTGKWKKTVYHIWGPEFEVGASRTKHRDGRIRNARSTLENGLAFALFCIEYFPPNQRSLVWEPRLLNEKLVLGTMDKRVRKWFFMPDSVVTVAAAAEAHAVASTLSKVSA
jgi:hypothetical protein